MPELLRMHGVHKRFGPTIALAGVDLEVHAGEVLALVGENGAGKSTLMKVLSGAHLPDEGEMWLDGQPYAPRNPLDARRAGGDDLPGAFARPASFRDGKHPARHGANTRPADEVGRGSPPGG